ncbi:J domain-containing protein [Rhodococcus koreensis]|uniref:Molecular chaperone DnaJ n=1 Tax=Rhodococcus koreensis TaxID=99653 RepID=A0A1H4LAX0_9NOCA|nr:DnaJ domain-containing protein [Rhodococcus koreensis]SEB67312.1 molecular chaperone DnaJ [Rhodococcus koreensis]
MSVDRDPYRVLGVTPAASQSEIARAYRRLLRRHHPDTRGPGPADPGADEHLQQILAAYTLLRDPVRARDHTAPRGAEPDRQQRRAPPPRIRVRIVPRPAARRVFGVTVRIGPVHWHH